jgi:hypothetical protein
MEQDRTLGANADKRKGLGRRASGDRRLVRALVASLVVLGALATGGCGGEDRLSRGELVREATAICGPVQRQLEALPQPQSLVEVELYAREAGELTEGGLEQLQELRPPESLEAAYNSYLDRAERVVELLDELEGAAADDDTAESQRLLGEIGRVAETRELARAAGIEACEREPGP